MLSKRAEDLRANVKTCYHFAVRAAMSSECSGLTMIVNLDQSLPNT